MKKYLRTGIILLLTVAVSAMAAHGQGIGGFFNQNKRQKQYLLQQIAALKVYDGYLQKGYAIAKAGTGVISTIKSSDLSLQTGHFDSLKIVSTSVRNYSRVNAVIRLQQQIIDSHNKAYSQLTGRNGLSVKELNAYNVTYQAILQQSKADLEELQLVTTNGKLSMTDDERIGKIDKLYKQMRDLYGQKQQINKRAITFAAQRARASRDNKILKRLYQ